MQNLSPNVIIDTYKREINEFVEGKFEQMQRELCVTNENPEILYNKIAKKIRSIACEIYKVSEIDILKKRCDNGLAEITETIVLILKEHTSLSDAKICNIVNKQKTKVYQSRINHKQKDPKIKPHKIYLENYKLIEDAFIEFKNNGYN
jgi:hypothetical protein